MKLDTNIRQDWTNVKLGEICEKAAKIKRKEVIPEEEFIYLDIGGIDNHSNRIIDHKIYQWKDAPSRAQQVVKVGDTLFSTVRTYLRNIAMVDNSKYENQICSSGFTVIRATNGLADSKFLFDLLLFEGFLKPLNKLQTGTSYPAVRDDDVFSQIIPLPPLPEQRAIVAKIELLFSDLDNGIANLKKAHEQLKIYRQAVLKKAFEGELTRKWREEQTDLPSVEDLLLQIKEEREKQYQKQLDEWKKAVKEWEDKGKAGKKPSRPKKTKELPPLSEGELKELPELPEGWCWIKVDKLLEHDQYSIKAGPFGSALKKQFYVKSGYKIYGQEQVISGNPYFGDYYIDNNKYNALISCAIKPQDILISLVGTVGKVLILPDNIKPGIINPRLIKISLNERFYKTIFFKCYFESMFLKSLYKIHAHGATMEIINLGIIQDLPFPFCSTQEQSQIVREIETRLSLCDKLEETIAEAQQKSEALRQSILKKAFEGKLLNEKELEGAHNAPDWEPADKLLERIKTEKEKPGTKKSFLREHSVNSLPK